MIWALPPEIPSSGSTLGAEITTPSSTMANRRRTSLGGKEPSSLVATSNLSAPSDVNESATAHSSVVCVKTASAEAMSLPTANAGPTSRSGWGMPSRSDWLRTASVLGSSAVGSMAGPSWVNDESAKTFLKDNWPVEPIASKALSRSVTPGSCTSTLLPPAT